MFLLRSLGRRRTLAGPPNFSLPAGAERSWRRFDHVILVEITAWRNVDPEDLGNNIPLAEWFNNLECLTAAGSTDTNNVTHVLLSTDTTEAFL